MTQKLTDRIRPILDEVLELYLADPTPWVIGYSGGKDSTAVVQLVWTALTELAPEQRLKPVYVISTDTQVENPIVSLWVGKSLEQMSTVAAQDRMPLTAHKLTPALKDSFWVNLIGRGYPAPRPKFRWCTERLKINPSNKFILDVANKHGEAILVLGTRKAESSRRAASMAKYEEHRIRDRLSPNAKLPNCLVYSPIEDWTNDDVWLYLMQVQNPWGYDNKALLTMYSGATEDGECPLVVDTTTPSCGDSRFGCWVCTLVDKDKSMTAMIQNDEEKEWMLPLLELRDQLSPKNGDRHLRDFRRMNGSVQLFHGRPIPGPYLESVRHDWLRKVLEAQSWIREHGPESVRDIDLISLEELEEIRRLWIQEKHEFGDALPGIYEDVCAELYPGGDTDVGLPFGQEEADLLAEVADTTLQFEMLRALVGISRRERSTLRRAGIQKRLRDVVRRHFYADQEDAVQFARLKPQSDK